VLPRRRELNRAGLAAHIEQTKQRVGDAHGRAGW
jgi:hypothetical protein